MSGGCCQAIGMIIPAVWQWCARGGGVGPGAQCVERLDGGAEERLQRARRSWGRGWACWARGGESLPAVVMGASCCVVLA